MHTPLEYSMTGFVIGLVAGLFGGLVGLGGGVIMIPLMVGFLKMSQHRAHGTSLVALVFTGISGAFIYFQKGSVDILASVLLAATAIFTATAGARCAHALPEWKLKRGFGGFLLIVSLLLLMKPYLVHQDHSVTLIARAGILLATGIFTGFLSGMMGVGGGTIMVPAMVLLAGIDQHTAQGISLLAMVPAGAVGAATHWKLGNVERTILFGLISGILIGAYAGGLLAHLFLEGVLRVVFACVLILTGVRYVRSPAENSSPRN